MGPWVGPGGARCQVTRIVQFVRGGTSQWPNKPSGKSIFGEKEHPQDVNWAGLVPAFVTKKTAVYHQSLVTLTACKVIVTGRTSDACAGLPMPAQKAAATKHATIGIADLRLILMPNT